jgi:hypothetical protein
MRGVARSDVSRKSNLGSNPGRALLVSLWPGAWRRCALAQGRANAFSVRALRKRPAPPAWAAGAQQMMRAGVTPGFAQGLAPGATARITPRSAARS